MEQAILDGESIAAMHAFSALYAKDNWNRWSLAQLLSRLSLETDNLPALQLAELYGDNLRHLWRDANFSGQALYTLLEGPIGEPLEPQVTEDEVDAALAAAEATASDLTIASHYLDGIHCAGSDPRLSGLLMHMANACTIYERLGRLDPTDDFAAILGEPQK